MAQAVQQAVAERQLGLYGSPEPAPRSRQATARRRERRSALCGACRAREARYGFSDEGIADPLESRPRALCFECFRMELDRRQEVRARLARGCGQQVGLPLDERLKELTRRRRRAQIAARHALGL